MNLVDDARRLNDPEHLPCLLEHGCCDCPWCHEKPHNAECPVLALPRIVAVVAAAERLIRAERAIFERDRAGLSEKSVVIGYDISPDPFYDEEDRAHAALVAALENKEPES